MNGGWFVRLHNFSFHLGIVQFQREEYMHVHEMGNRWILTSYSYSPKNIPPFFEVFKAEPNNFQAKEVSLLDYVPDCDIVLIYTHSL